VCFFFFFFFYYFFLLFFFNGVLRGGLVAVQEINGTKMFVGGIEILLCLSCAKCGVQGLDCVGACR